MMKRKIDLHFAAMSLEEILVATMIMSVLSLAVFEGMRMTRALARMTEKGASVAAEVFATGSVSGRTFIQDSLSRRSFERMKEIQDSCEMAAGKPEDMT